MDHFYELPICQKCQKSPDSNNIFACITKTRAKKEYLLTDDDLSTFDHIEARNPYYRNSPAMMLFLKSDVEQYADEKHQGKLEELQAKRTKKSQTIKDNKVARQNIRTEELKTALEKVGLELRSDSRLCQGYIENKLDQEWTLDEIVSMCAEMRWLYQYTDYKKKLDQAVQDEAEAIAEWEGWHGAHRKAYDEVEPEVRHKVLKSHPKPSIWPWQQNKTITEILPSKKKELNLKLKQKI
jgi:hypothetical protein